MTTPAHVPPEVFDCVGDVARTLATLRPDLVGVYVHGSAVLGGFTGRSDVDVLAVVGNAGTSAGRRAMGEAIVAASDQCPGTGLEMSVITAATASVLGPCLFEVHVNTTGDDPVIVTGAGSSGDPDLILHSAVCRDHAVAVLGPPPGEVFGPVPRDRVRSGMVSDLRWALDHGLAAYAVLNACRAMRFVAEGVLCSKLDGARWYLTRHPGNPPVTAAAAFQSHTGQGPDAEEATEFVQRACERLRPP